MTNTKKSIDVNTKKSIDTMAAENNMTTEQFLYTVEKFGRLYADLYQLWNICDSISEKDRCFEGVDMMAAALEVFEKGFFKGLHLNRTLIHELIAESRDFEIKNDAPAFDYCFSAFED